MAGAAPAATGMVGFADDPAWSPAHTLPGELSKAGYQTQLIGKLHLQPLRKRYGFQHMMLADSHRGTHNDYVHWLGQSCGRQEWSAGMSHGVSANAWVGRPTILPEEQTHTFWCYDQALKFMDRRDPSCPFFLKISTIDPHPPLTPPAFYYDRYIHRDLPPVARGDWNDAVLADTGAHLSGPKRGSDPDAAHIWLDEHHQRCLQAGYYGLCNFIDDQIGRFMQAFGQRIARNTLFIFTSDHGEMLGDHCLFRKTYAYEASARVPFVICPPTAWGLPSGMICESPVDLQDIMPTCLDAAGIDIPDTCTGRSLLPILRGETDRVRDVLHGEHTGCYDRRFANQWLVSDTHKYIWHSQTGREQLFNLADDPNETHDLALANGAGELLAPWRERLIDVLRDRPEGFVDAGRLVAGVAQPHLIPGYNPHRTYAFV